MQYHQKPPNFPLNGDKLGRWAPITDQLSPKLAGYFRLLNLTYNKAKELEVSTQKQSECPQWHELRYPRLTASTFGKMCSKMETPRAKPELVATDLLQTKPHTTFTNRMLTQTGQWKWTCCHPSLQRITSTKACVSLWMWNFHKPGGSTFSCDPWSRVLWPQWRKSLGDYWGKMPIQCKGPVTNGGFQKTKQLYEQYQGWCTFPKYYAWLLLTSTRADGPYGSHMVWFCDTSSQNMLN